MLLASTTPVAELGGVPPSLELLFVEPGADPDPSHLGAEVIVLGAELAHLVGQLDRFERLTLVQTLNAGVEWLLPRVPDGVVVCNASGPHDAAVAGWVVAVTLAHLHRLPHFAGMQREGRWDTEANALTAAPEDIVGDDLEAKAVTIVGYGSIGRAVARRLEGFDARVRGVVRHPTDEADVHGPDELPRLVADTDVLVLMCPLTDETSGLVDADLLSRLPDGAIVVNASRGPVVDQDALEAELRAGRLRAALDVTDPEPLPEGHSLWTAPNLILTPHAAGSTRRWKARAHRFVGDQLRRYAAGEPLRNVRVGY